MDYNNIWRSLKLSPVILTAIHRLRTFRSNDHDQFLKYGKGVIHVGASTGGERKLYRAYRLPVIWIEPIPEVYEMLCRNINGYPNNLAIQALVTDKLNAEYTFNISNHDGASSSILELNYHKDIWPDVVFERQIRLKSTTLTDLLQKERIESSKYNVLVIDAQGAELLVLKGAGPLLKDIQFIKVEAADFEIYKNCCQLKDLVEFLHQFGFIEISRHQFAEREDGGGCYNVIFERK